MSNSHRTGSHRIKFFAERPKSDDELRAELAAIGARTETCKHGYDFRSCCNSGCDDPQIPTPILALEDGAR